MSEAPGEPVSRLQSVTLRGVAGAIEGLLQEFDATEPELAAVVCHPHPLFGGTLHNKVVHRVASTLHELGAAVLRFNFRGVGRSEGVHDRGVGELEDARVALAWLRERHPAARCWVAGFSFGSWVASRLGASEPGIERMILIAPPVHTQTFEEMRTSPVPKLVVQGTADDVCKPENLARVFPGWAEPKRLMPVEGAGHFFDRRLAELAIAIREGIR
ncbi:MAG TPA: alpha/beta fold hydrolase [Candidatus Acidoferrales bacterium]|nr:alpha/beta fold hydrolase [Candidatus Acidoferrales bacterium]